MEMEVVNTADLQKFRGQGAISHKHVLADAWVVKASDLGINDNKIHTRTHLGGILKPGDSVLGYYLADFNVNDAHFEKLKETEVPDVILVKKYYGDRASRRRARIWKLRHLNEEATSLNKTSADFQEFLEDLEEDPALRQNVNIYKDKDAEQIAVSYDEMDDPTYPKITLAEMLDDLQLDNENEEAMEQ